MSENCPSCGGVLSNTWSDHDDALMQACHGCRIIRIDRRRGPWERLMCWLGVWHETVQEGDWCDPSTWRFGLVPYGPVGTVIVRHRITISDMMLTARVSNLRFDVLYPLC